MSLSVVKRPSYLCLSKQTVIYSWQSDAVGTPLRIKANLTGQTISDSIAVDSSKQATFELSDYLQGLITERYRTDATPHHYYLVPLFTTFEFTEMVGSPPVAGDTITSYRVYLIDGYVPRSRRKALYAEYSSLLDYINAKTNFLTWFPAGECKLIDKEQAEFVNYLQMNSAEPTTLYSKIVLHFTDGGSATKSNAFAGVTNIAYGKIVYFPCGYNQLNIQGLMDTTYDNKTLDYYTFQVSQLFNFGLQQQSFKVDNNYTENIRLLYIRNAFGFLEIVRCTGKGEQTNKLNIEIARTDGRVLPDKVSWKQEKEDLVKVNTGHLTKAQMQWLSDMDFTEAYEMQGTVLHPIVFRDLMLPVIHDDVYQYSAELEYEYAYNETAEQS